MKKYLLIICSLGLVVLFQNCQQATNFGSKDGAFSKADTSEITPVVMPDAEDNSPVPPKEEDNQTPNNDDDEVASNDDDNDADDQDKEEDNGEDKDKRTCKERKGLIYVCILKGSGKSLKLGSSDRLAGQNEIPDVLCMTKKGCLEIAAQAFDVEGAYVRGYCSRSNPHVKHISDDNLASKIKEVIAQ